MIEPANAIVAPIPPKAMPLILTTDEERDIWMRAGRRAHLAFMKYINMRDGQCTAISTTKPDKETVSQEGMKWDA